MHRARHRRIVLALVNCAVLFVSCVALAQEVVDRIVAKVENDIILLSEVRDLGSYQILVDGKPESDAQILDRLIDQWIVRNEADASRFHLPSDTEVSSAVERLRKSFSSPEEYESRKKESGLTDTEIRAVMSRQLYLSNYLESRFRPSIQIDPKEIESFYQSNIVARARARGQEPPSLEAARDAIQEALVQLGINQEADRWLKESRGRLRIEKLLDKGSK